MLKSYRNIIRTVYLNSGESSRPSETLTDFKSFLNYRYRMIAKQKQKYDGRLKKRQWEERRSEPIESILDTKKIKVEEEHVESVAEKIKRRKFCLMLGYSGANYYGMQRNPKTKTIEEELLKALFKVGYIDELCYNQVQNMQFQRAARTDKGVSAARQIVSLKLLENVNKDLVNAELPEDIRIFSLKRVTKGFNSKSQCDSRTYTYIIPTAAFADYTKDISQKDFRIDNEQWNKINELLHNFIGTKNYHNYTSKKKPDDPSAKRYMKSFNCEKPFVRKDVEFVVLKVQGQSFMLHQIRKMVGLLLAVVRGLGSVEILKNSFNPEKLCIPRAPGLGLVLDYVHYDRYNYRYGEDGMHEKLTWEEVEDQVQDFKEKYIYPTIIDTEINEEQMMYWLHNKLSRHSYDKENESDNEGDNDDNDEDEKINNVDCDKNTLSNKT